MQRRVARTVLVLGLAGALGAVASARAEPASRDPDVLSTEALDGACTAAAVHGDDWTDRCSHLAMHVRLRDGHVALSFFIESVAVVTFRGVGEVRRDPGLHVLQVDGVRIGKRAYAAKGQCLVAGRFSDPARLAFDQPVSIRCHAALAGEDVADVSFATSGPARDAG